MKRILFFTVCISLILTDVVGADVSDQNAELIQAAAQGNLMELEAALIAGADVNAKDTNYAEATALMWAAQNGHVPVVERLLEAGADVNIKCTANRANALWFAAKNGHLKVVKLLLEWGGKINSKARRGGIELTEALEEAADENGGEKDAADPITPESCFRYLEMIYSEIKDYFFDGYIPSDAKFSIIYDELLSLVTDSAWAEVVTSYDDGISALWMAAQHGHTSTVKLLLENGVEFDARAANGSTALMSAAQNGHTEIVKLLCEWCADTNVKVTLDNIEYSALKLAKHIERKDIVGILESVGTKE